MTVIFKLTALTCAFNNMFEVNEGRRSMKDEIKSLVKFAATV
jgi:hypothetical protein